MFDFSAVTVTFSWRPYLTLVPSIAIESHFAVGDTSVGVGPSYRKEESGTLPML